MYWSSNKVQEGHYIVFVMLGYGWVSEPCKIAGSRKEVTFCMNIDQFKQSNHRKLNQIFLYSNDHYKSLLWFDL